MAKYILPWLFSCQSHLTAISAAVVISKYGRGVAREKHSAQLQTLFSIRQHRIDVHLTAVIWVSRSKDMRMALLSPSTLFYEWLLQPSKPASLPHDGGPMLAQSERNLPSAFDVQELLVALTASPDRCSMP